MKPPVLVVALPGDARTVRTALEDTFALTVVDDLERARAFASTGGFVAVLATPPLSDQLPSATAIDPRATPDTIVTRVLSAAGHFTADMHAAARDDLIGAVSYDDYVELSRYAAMRRYLFALLTRHGGSVTDAARGANMKRESLHRLMRRYHVVAEDFRSR